MKQFWLLAIALSVLLMSGCAMVPGQRMSVRSLTHGDSPESGHVKLVQITADMLPAKSASGSQQAVPAALLDYQPQPYQIGTGDTLYITVWDHPELTSPAGTQQQTLANGRLVRPDGTLFYPYIGNIKAAGLTIEQLREAISSKLGKFVENPQVDVGVIGYGSQRVILRGAFTKTDPQSVTAVPLTLGQAIGNAGVNTDLADLTDLVLTRDGHSYHIDLTAPATDQGGAKNIYLKPGDSLFLPYNESREVYVVGEVLRPQAISFKTTDLNLTQVIGRAGGLNPVTSDGGSIYVIRGVADLKVQPATVFHLDGESPAAFALADNFTMRPGDVVWVGPSGVTQWNRVLSQLLPLSGIVGNAALANERLDR